MKKISIAIIILLISFHISKGSDYDLELYINNKPVETKILLFNEKTPLAAIEVLSSELDLYYEIHSDSLFLEDRLFTGVKLAKDDTLFVSLEDFAGFFNIDYKLDLKAGTVDLRTFNIRLQNSEVPRTESESNNIAPEKTGKEIKVIYEVTENQKNNIFAVYLTLQNISEKIADRVVVTCIFSLPGGQIVEKQFIDLNTLNPGDYREINFSITKPTMSSSGNSLSYNKVTTPDGGVHSTIAYSGGVIAPEPLITPDYELKIDYQIRL